MDLKIKRGNYIKAVIEKFIKTEPKIDEKDLAYLLWELGDFEILDVEKLLKELNKELKK